MGSRGYHDFNMRVAGNSPVDWGGTDYSSIMFQVSDTYPPAVITESFAYIPHSAGASGNYSTSETFDVIIPTVFDAVSIIDGTITGNIRVGISKTDLDNSSSTLTSIDAILTIVESDGTSAVVKTKEVWAGALASIYIGSEQLETLQTRFWVDVNDIVLSSDQRLLVSYTLNFDVVTLGFISATRLYVYCTDETYETTISLPMVM